MRGRRRQYRKEKRMRNRASGSHVTSTRAHNTALKKKLAAIDLNSDGRCVLWEEICVWVGVVEVGVSSRRVWNSVDPNT
jgi:hypothetical protein